MEHKGPAGIQDRGGSRTGYAQSATVGAGRTLLSQSKQDIVVTDRQPSPGGPTRILCIFRIDRVHALYLSGIVIGIL